MLPLVPKLIKVFIYDPEHDFKNVAILVRNKSEFWKAAAVPGCRVRWENPALTDYIFEALMECGNCVLFVDEADEIFSQSNLNDVRWRMAKRGRHSGVGMIMITQSATAIKAAVRRTAVGVIAGNTIEDKKILREKYGIDMVPCDRKFYYSVNAHTGILNA